MKPTLTLTALFLLSGTLFAQEVSLTGAHSAQGALPVGNESWATGFDGAMKEPQLTTDLGLSITDGPVKLVSKWNATTTPAGTTLANEEAYLAWNPDNFKFSLGNQIFAWGTADGRNPTDNLNPRDYTSISGQKIRKLPVLSASAVWYPSEAWSVEAVFVPVAGTSLFPTDTAASLRAEGLTVTETTLANSPASAVAGGRLNYRSTAFDASVSYLYDEDSQWTPVVNSDFSITLERRRIQRFGADVKTTVDRFGLWAEGAYSLTANGSTSDYSERLSRFDATVGGDFSYGPADAYYLNLQLSGTWTPGYDASANTFALSDRRHLLKALTYSLAGVNEELLTSLTLSSHWNLAADTVVPSLSASYSLPFHYDDSAQTRYGSLLLKPELEFTPVDSFHITVGAVLAASWKKAAGQDSLTLDTSDALGVYTPQNNVFINVSYQWNATLNP